MSRWRPSARLRSLGTYGAATTLPRGVTFLMLLILAEAVGPSGYAVYSAALAAAAAVAVVGALGLSHAASRQYFNHSDDAPRRRALLRTLWNVSASSAVAVAGAAAAVAVLTGWGSSVVPVEVLIPALLAVALATGGLEVPLSVLRSQERRGAFLALVTTQAVLTAAAAYLSVVVLGWGVLGWLWGTVIANGASLILAHRLVRVGRITSWDRSGLRAALRFGLPLLPHSLALIILQPGDRFIVAASLPLEDAGTYALAATLAMPVGLVSMASHHSLIPTYARAASEGRGDGLRLEARAHVQVVCSVAVVWAVLAPLVVIAAFGDGYQAAASILPLACLAGLFAGVYLVPMTRLTFVAGRTGAAWRVTVVAAATSIAAVSIGARFGGVHLAAAGVAVGTAVLLLGMARTCRRSGVGHDLNGRATALIGGASAVLVALSLVWSLG